MLSEVKILVEDALEGDPLAVSVVILAVVISIIISIAIWGIVNG